QEVIRLENKRLLLRVEKKRPAELARWMQLSVNRKRAAEAILPGRIRTLDFDEEGMPFLPIYPPVTSEEIRIGHPVSRASLFSFTTKMGCASFSLAAGPMGARGTCHAANLPKEGPNGFVALARAAEAEGSRVDLPAIEAGRREPKDVKSVPLDRISGMWICGACYAGKADYVYDSIACYMAAKKIWVERSLADGTFVLQMKTALERVLSNDALMRGKLASGNHFRIHDSGDFYRIPFGENPFAYFDGWAEVIASLPQVRFWAPTRMWVFPDWRKHMVETFARYGTKLSNFSLRPSALVYGSLAPMIAGLPAGSTSASGELPETWECPAYKSVEGSCVGACCRTCWDRPDVPVSYHTH
ncbi:MAG: GP88 family protein, partial [Thermoplasmata archaeon]